MIEIETSTLLTIIGGYFVFFTIWARMAYTFKSLYNKKLSKYIWNTLNFSVVASSLVYCFYTNFVTALLNKLYKNNEAYNIISSLSGSYNNFIYVTWFTIAVLFISWALIAFFLDIHERHLKEDNKDQP